MSVTLIKAFKIIIIGIKNSCFLCNTLKNTFPSEPLIKKSFHNL